MSRMRSTRVVYLARVHGEFGSASNDSGEDRTRTKAVLSCSSLDILRFRSA